MRSINLPRVTLRAAVYEIELGLFHVSYQAGSDEWHVHGLPIYQVGSCTADAKQRIEATARACGFESILWNEEPDSATPPLFLDEIAAPITSPEATPLTGAPTLEGDHPR